MKRYQKEIMKITAGEVLSRIFDLAVPFFEASSCYRISAKKWKEERDFEKSMYSERINYLKRHGLIEDFVEGKEKFLEITPKGLKKLDEIRIANLTIERPEVWDGKWRIILFDIPNKIKVLRDIFRQKLVKLGFQKIQESIYVYPFECTTEIQLITSNLDITNYVLLLISEIIQGEDTIIEKFIKCNVLESNDIKK